MLEKVKYDIGDRISAEIRYVNSPFKKAEGTIRRIEIGESEIRYWVEFDRAEPMHPWDDPHFHGMVTQDTITNG